MAINESVLVIDKIPGPSSFDCVREARTLARGMKAGHAGSLDPFASGVLVLLMGRATKLSNALLNADKSYHAILKLGEATDTMDRTGTVTNKLEVPPLTEADVVAVLKGFEGTWMQTPPMYSAKKIQGVRLYKLARQNISVERLPIPVQLHRVDLIKFESPYLHFEVECSKGTYIRSLADEIGSRLNTAAHLAELRRLSCGNFRLEESITLDVFAQDPARYLTEGYRNYTKLLRAEGLVRGPADVAKGANSSSFANAPQQW